MVRTELREHIFKMLFQIEFNDSVDMPENLNYYFETLEDAKEKDKQYIQNKYEAILSHIEEIDGLLNENATGWKTTRMNKVDLSILRLALYEIKWDEDVPAKVAINEAVELAKRNVQMNDLEEQIEIIHGDIKEVVKNLPKAQLIVCNPPFFKVGEDSNLNENEYLTIARHEVKIDLEGIISSAAYLLDNKGRFAIVHRPDRMIDILNLMQKYDIEPKRIRFVYPKMNRESHVLLVEGMYKGKKGIKIESPLYAHNDDGSYSNEVRRMFGEKIDE